ncbi:metallophosphoesterase [Echinicola jeungdonensis]|uniref:Metallophosphoesterase n=1 Tax=Echinicola jeungdonensis TaxID=709343 RepID=A0ABV5J8W2_9BACT|nr:metallophosphoesterase [Echinicola jeungdonensis]MDN3670236.1 metallophosphoesterase [Echinicola jeungdonensis]
MKKSILILTLILIIGFKEYSIGQSLKLVILPDTQSYLESCPEIMESQFKWLAKNKDKVDMVLHVGDITQSNTPAEWALAGKYFDHINGKIPYALSLGNHDFGSGPGKYADNRDSQLANKYFPLDTLKKYTPIQGEFEKDKIDNAYYTFEKKGGKWLILSLEFGPTDEMLAWANEVARAHPDHKIILLTHSYMYVGNKRQSEGDDWRPHGYGIGKNNPENAPNDGQQIWKKLVSKHPNFLFTFSGHVLHEGLGKLVSKGEHGNKVYQFLANYQRGVQGYGNGCNGYLRIVNIDLDRDQLEIKTYSPWLDQWLDDSENHFTLQLKMKH